MVFTLIQKFFFVVLIGQTILSILNSQFTLHDANAAVAVFGFYGALRNHRHSLLLVRMILNYAFAPLVAVNSCSRMAS
jgi:hypothetical protein